MKNLPDTKEISAIVVSREDVGLPEPYTAPNSDRERAVAAEFERVLCIAPVGLDDEFFDLGGDSMAAEQITMALSARFKQDIPVSALFYHGSPKTLAARIDTPTEVPAEEELQEPTYFMVHARHGWIFPRQAFLSAIPDGHRLVTLELPGLRHGRAAPTRISDMAAIHVEQIERLCPTGPIYLASFCTGWLIATEIARHFSAKGRPVAKVVLFDPDVPRTHYRRFRCEAAGRNMKPALSRLMRRMIGFRFFDASWKGEFEDRTSYWLRVLWFWLYGPDSLRQRDEWYRVFRREGRSHLAVAKLLSCYHSYYPDPFPASAHLVISRWFGWNYKRCPGYWDRVLPNRSEEKVAVRHEDLNRADGAIAAKAMLRAFSGESGSMTG